NAESTSPLAASFTQVSSALKLYRRQGERVLGPIPTSESLQNLVMRPSQPHRGSSSSPSGHAPAAGRHTLHQDRRLQEARNSRERLGHLLLGLPIGVVVIDRRYDIQIINGNAMRLLGIFTEPLGEDLIHLAQTIPSDAFRTVIDTAFRSI